MKKKVLFLGLLALLLTILIFLTGCSENNSNNNDSNENSNSESNTDSKDNETTDEYNDNYLGDYEWKSGDDRIQFELIRRDGKIDFYLMYYPDGFTSPAEEIWGTWKTDKDIELVDNENIYAIATYSFSNITYRNENEVEITIKSKNIIYEQFKDSKIPDGTYVFKKY